MKLIKNMRVSIPNEKVFSSCGYAAYLCIKMLISKAKGFPFGHAI
jgi:hypothetical protein